MDDVDLKRRFMMWVGKLTGLYEVSVEPKRNMRSNQQLRYWFACCVRPFYEFLCEQEASDVPNLQAAHDLIRGKFLTVEIFDPRSGEIIGSRTRHTKELTTTEMNDFMERGRHWLQDQFGIVTMDPNENLQEQAASAAGK